VVIAIIFVSILTELFVSQAVELTKVNQIQLQSSDLLLVQVIMTMHRRAHLLLFSMNSYH
jgi:hypothetical protein